jgi:NAD(P)-dependent dehydrogenase (short-subunit alcohol dehydrogenase family)
MFAKIESEFGRLDVIFNNAGTNVPATNFGDLEWSAWKKVIDVNLNGMFLCASGAFKLMQRQKPQGGRIINNGSISAHVPRPGSAPYTSSKHAVTGLTRSISLDGRPYDIACGQIDIGNAASHMTEAMSAGVPQADGSMKPEPTMDVTHVADAIVHMAGLPLDANVQFMTIMSTKMPFIGRG